MERFFGCFILPGDPDRCSEDGDAEEVEVKRRFSARFTCGIETRRGLVGVRVVEVGSTFGPRGGVDGVKIPKAS